MAKGIGFGFFALMLVLGSLGASAYATVATNPVIDLTAPASQEPQTDAEIFDESVIFSPNFAINQNDPALSSLFGTGGVSNLCFPTSLAEVLVDLYGYHEPKFDRLALNGLSTNHESIDPNALVSQLAAACKTDPNNGTQLTDGLNCIDSLFSQAGYGLGNTELISAFATSNVLPIETRVPTIEDFRTALKAGNPLILEVAWFAYDPTNKSWNRQGGHYVSIYGYDYDLSWGESMIQLKAINPETAYLTNRSASLWDSITLQRYSPQPGITYPENRPFIVSGSGFGGLTKRGYIGGVFVIAPTQ
jgi:hypothetical protein